MGGELSAPIETLDGTGLQGARKRVGNKEFLYALVPASAVVGAQYVVSYDGDEETCPALTTAATLAVYQEVAVVLATQGATAGFQWVQVAGKCQMLVEGTTDVAKDDFLELLNTETSAKKDATTRSVNSFAIACAAQTSATPTLTDVILLGGRVIIAAS